jgi:hypothetical protein
LAAWQVSRITQLCDVLITTSTGPHIVFSAAVWDTRLNMQVISTALPLSYHHTNTKMRMMAGRHVGAFRKALHTLEML